MIRLHGLRGELSLSIFLFDVLVGPVEKHISGISNLVIVPDDELDGLPFEMLKKEKGGHVLQDHNITYNRSVSLVKLSSPNSFNANIVIIPLAIAAIVVIIYFSRRRQIG